jgi:hypothetical protein
LLLNNCYNLPSIEWFDCRGWNDNKKYVIKRNSTEQIPRVYRWIILVLQQLHQYGITSIWELKIPQININLSIQPKLKWLIKEIGKQKNRVGQ